ncbi:hypothetical protein [Dongshaea marina]|uniref:hypothetical protein n=1 Tax=Dongshaea marina TaxID=2047966 RepID=UPI000D3E6913|nr:hypothetical protein [Dongshaea marina]
MKRIFVDGAPNRRAERRHRQGYSRWFTFGERSVFVTAEKASVCLPEYIHQHHAPEDGWLYVWSEGERVKVIGWFDSLPKPVLELEGELENLAPYLIAVQPHIKQIYLEDNRNPLAGVLGELPVQEVSGWQAVPDGFELMADRKAPVSGVVAGVISVALLVGGGYAYWQHQPSPQTLQVRVVDPYAAYQQVLAQQYPIAPLLSDLQRKIMDLQQVYGWHLNTLTIKNGYLSLLLNNEGGSYTQLSRWAEQHHYQLAPQNSGIELRKPLIPRGGHYSGSVITLDKEYPRIYDGLNQLGFKPSAQAVERRTGYLMQDINASRADANWFLLDQVRQFMRGKHVFLNGMMMQFGSGAGFNLNLSLKLIGE